MQHILDKLIQNPDQPISKVLSTADFNRLKVAVAGTGRDIPLHAEVAAVLTHKELEALALSKGMVITFNAAEWMLKKTTTLELVGCYGSLQGVRNKLAKC